MTYFTLPNVKMWHKRHNQQNKQVINVCICCVISAFLKKKKNVFPSIFACLHHLHPPSLTLTLTEHLDTQQIFFSWIPWEYAASCCCIGACLQDWQVVVLLRGFKACLSLEKCWRAQSSPQVEWKIKGRSFRR